MALGKGLGALLNTDNVLDNVLDDKNIIELKISQIEPNKDQPRIVFDEEKLAALAESIEEYGVITPIVVKKLDNGNLLVTYKQGVKAVTEGQACVLYNGDECLGGGIIKKVNK